MKNWFEKFSKQYFKEKYDYYYRYDHNKELYTFKKIGSVYIDGNIVKCSIEHGKYEYNRIKIKFKPFSDEEINELNKIINDNPINTFKLINKTLPDDLLNCGIEILPESLDDLEIECTMNDDERNLIDILSVLKGFNRKLEKNDFLIFKMKGLDLTRTIDYPVKTIEDIFSHNFKSSSEETSLTNLYDINVALLYNVIYPTTSFDCIYSELFDLLRDEIDLFASINYNKEYVNYDDLTTSTIKSQKEKQKFFKDKWNIENDISIDIDNDYNMNGKISSERNLFAFLNELNQVNIKDIDKRIVFLQDILKLTYRLVHLNCIMPQIFKTENIYRVRWIPSFYSENVLNLCESYYSDCPDDLITFNNKSLSKENQVIILISLFMNGLIQYCVEKNQIKRFDRNISDAVFNLFIGKTRKLRKMNKTLESINKRLFVFYLKELDFKYALFINDDLNIEIKIKKDGEYKNIKDADIDELKYINRVYDLFTQFKIDNTIYEPVTLNNNDFIVFNEKIKPVLEYMNVELTIPFDIIECDFKLILDTPLTKKDFKFNKISDYQWIIELKNQQITISEFDKITDDMNPLIKIGDKAYIVNGYEFRVLKRYVWLLQRGFDSHEILQLALLGEYGDLKFEVSEKLKNLINASTIYNVPQSFTGELRPYQRIGYSWLVQNIKSGFGSILADDMGLGKTVQVLTAILYFKENNPLEANPALIIVPPTLISNWEQEINKFTPELSYYIYHGSNRIFPLDYYDIILTSYSVIRIDLEMFLDWTWFICVIDEAQNIKNPSTQQTKAIKSIGAFNKIALTGTPIENRLTDYWSIFDFINKGYLSTISDFKANFVTSIERMEDKQVLENLKTIAKPFVLRRLKSDDEIKHELPEKFVNDIYCSLTKKQIKLYNAILDGLFENLDDKKGIERKGTILKIITSLKQTCNHPAQFLKSDNPTIKESGKMELLVNVLENIMDMDEKVLIFTQYVKMGEIIQKLISKKFKTEVLFLHGSQTRKEKSEIIDTFQKDGDYKILVATLKTGGTGLNLTAAQNVIHYDLWWNPAVENQATDRVHRIGQENDVMVYRFITKGTLEENIDLISKNKLDLAEKAISTDETFITELSNEELKEILRLRI